MKDVKNNKLNVEIKRRRKNMFNNLLINEARVKDMEKKYISEKVNQQIKKKERLMKKFHMMFNKRAKLA